MEDDDELLPPLSIGGITFSCEDVDEIERNVLDVSELRLLCVIPESGDVLQLIEEEEADAEAIIVSVSMERRVLSSSVEAKATKRSKPELTRSCHSVSSSAITSSTIKQEHEHRENKKFITLLSSKTLHSFPF